jgi:hypothetical protein
MQQTKRCSDTFLGTPLKKQSQLRPDLSTPLRFAQDDKKGKRLKKQSQLVSH